MATEDFDYCTACLVTGVKMHSLYAINIGEVFLSFLEIPLSSGKEEKSNLCFECAALLKKFEKFRAKFYKAQEILSTIRQDHCKITKTSIQNVNRDKHRLMSSISQSSTRCWTLRDDQKESDIPTVHVESLVYCDVKPDVECGIISVDIDLVKNELDINESTVNEYNDLNQVEEYYSDEIQSVNHTKSKRKSKTSTKEHRKKRKIRKEDSCNKDVESISDDEPLANISKTINHELEINGKKNIRKNFNISYFEDYATVVFLTAEEAKKELLLRKESSNYINSPLKCEFCYRGYEAKTAFDNHMKKHSSDYGEFICDICQLRFPEQRCLCKHRLACHKRKFCCKLCTYVCFCTHQAKTHVSLHKGKTYPCKECPEIFSMPNSLLMHKRLKHGTGCVCALCGNTFATPRGLYSHNMKVHRQDTNEKLGPKCEECGIHFATEEAWKRHLVLSSKHNVSNGCKKCGETFSNTEELKRHMRVHARKHSNRGNATKLPTTCAICGSYLLDRGAYTAHMAAAHPRSDLARKHAEELAPFICELCGLAFKKQCFLRYHQRKHTGERPYKCAACDAAFPHGAALAAHGAVHRPRRAACRLCQRAFTHKSALNKHMKVHLNIRPHRCDICDKSFISPCDVRLHIKYVHNKVPWPKRERTKRV